MFQFSNKLGVITIVGILEILTDRQIRAQVKVQQGDIINPQVGMVGVALQIREGSHLQQGLARKY